MDISINNISILNTTDNTPSKSTIEKKTDTSPLTKILAKFVSNCPLSLLYSTATASHAKQLNINAFGPILVLTKKYDKFNTK